MTRKFNDGARVIGNDVRASFRQRSGTVQSYAGEGEYWVKFDDGVEECVPSHWLDAV